MRLSLSPLHSSCPILQTLEMLTRWVLFGCRARWVSFGLEAGSWRRIQKSSKFRIKSSSMNRSQVELMSLQYGGLDVRTQQGLAGRDEAGCSGRCRAAVPTGNVGWLVLKSAAPVSPDSETPPVGPAVAPTLLS